MGRGHGPGGLEGWNPAPETATLIPVHYSAALRNPSMNQFLSVPSRIASTLFPDGLYFLVLFEA